MYKPRVRVLIAKSELDVFCMRRSKTFYMWCHQLESCCTFNPSGQVNYFVYLNE